MANMMTPLGCNKCGYRKRTTGELITLRARIGELEAENARLEDLRIREVNDAQSKAQDIYIGAIEENRALRSRIDQLTEIGRCTACSGSGYYDDEGSPPCEACNGTGQDIGSLRAELTRLKATQPEHDRTVRRAALEEAAKVCEATSWMRDIEWWLHATKREVSEVSALECAKAIRSLIDQTGGEGGI